jgi:ribonuclease P protein component
MVSRLRFPRQRRIRKRREFLLVQKLGRRVSARNFLFFLHPRLRPPAPELSTAGATSTMAMPTRFGITVTRKVGNAVVRNRIKRVVREGCRQLSPVFPAGIDVVIVARPTAVACGLGDVRSELSELLARLGGSRRP